ncbi:ATPase [Paraburkholderia domus]|uniref:ATPase n=1 Tax=Paraburkholderia domus TaxID=2793075 RepID=UPI001913A3BD|nr:ATPase [Paraburkholderia domus]MBK5065774.1 ATPase [Burkholderia sp. R-70199]CAE6962962.1 hypothetical protein R70199_07461 [Paraburkholderia domus]
MTIETGEVAGFGHNGADLAAHGGAASELPDFANQGGAIVEAVGGEAGGEPSGEAEDAPFTAELEQMTKTAAALQEQGLLTVDEAAEQVVEAEQTRRRYQNLSADEKRAINRRLKEQGRRLLERQVSGAPVIVETVTLNHNRLTPVLLTWWAFLNRMSVNIGRFGRSTFENQRNADTVQKWFEDQQTKLSEYAGEQLDVAAAFCTQAEQLIIEKGRKPLRPTITRPSLVIEVEAFTPYSYDLLQTIINFDKAMSYFDFMVFNRVRDQSDVDDEVNRFLNKLRPVGVRGLNTHRKLMLTIQNLH